MTRHVPGRGADGGGAPRATITIVGPGRVGSVLAAAHRALGDDVRTAGRGDDVAAAVLAADLVWLTVPDDALEAIARELARADLAAGRRFVHASGRHGVAVVAPLAATGGSVAACHPAMTFPPSAGPDRLAGVAWAVTADPAAVAWASALVVDLGGDPVVVREADRSLYHLALALASNATASIVTLARDLLLGAGLERPERFLADLARASTDGAARRGTDALSGPVRRGDAGTVAAHLAALVEVLPEALDVYRAVARLQLAQARRAGMPAAAAEALHTLLHDS